MDVFPLNVIPAPIWMILKILFLFLLFALIKAIVPRYRYDQLNEIRLENIFTILFNIFSAHGKFFILF